MCITPKNSVSSLPKERIALVTRIILLTLVPPLSFHGRDGLFDIAGLLIPRILHASGQQSKTTATRNVHTSSVAYFTSALLLCAIRTGR